MAWPTSMSASKKSFPMIGFHGSRVGKGELVRDASFRGCWGAEMAAIAASHQAPVNPCMSGTTEHEVGPSPGGDCCDRHKCPSFCHSRPASYKELVFSPLTAEISNDGEARLACLSSPLTLLVSSYAPFLTIAFPHQAPNICDCGT